jgi:hypothetical protein
MTEQKHRQSQASERARTAQEGQTGRLNKGQDQRGSVTKVPPEQGLFASSRPVNAPSEPAPKAANQAGQEQGQQGNN